jgi:hypothetical protein
VGDKSFEADDKDSDDDNAFEIDGATYDVGVGVGVVGVVVDVGGDICCLVLLEEFNDSA